jgi:hypothetical protein
MSNQCFMCLHMSHYFSYLNILVSSQNVGTPMLLPSRTDNDGTNVEESRAEVKEMETPTR